MRDVRTFAAGIGDSQQIDVAVLVEIRPDAVVRIDPVARFRRPRPSLILDQIQRDDVLFRKAFSDVEIELTEEFLPRALVIVAEPDFIPPVTIQIEDLNGDEFA